MLYGDSLIELYDYPDKQYWKGCTLEHFILNYITLVNFKKSNVFCFGLNDLSGGISWAKVIENYNILCRKSHKKCIIILPPLQHISFYEKCVEEIDDDAILILTFANDYTTIDKIHPSLKMLEELKKDLDFFR